MMGTSLVRQPKKIRAEVKNSARNSNIPSSDILRSVNVLDIVGVSMAEERVKEYLQDTACGETHLCRGSRERRVAP